MAHRLSTIRKADRIIVIGNGTVVEQGSHEQLMFLRGAYYNLITSQEIKAETDSDDKELSSSGSFAEEIERSLRKTETLKKVRSFFQ